MQQSPASEPPRYTVRVVMTADARTGRSQFCPVVESGREGGAMSTATTERDADAARLDEVERRATAIYEERLKAGLEREHLGAYVAVHPDSGEHAVGRTSADAMRAMRARQPQGLLFIRVIGPPTEGESKRAARLAAAELGRR